MSFIISHFIFVYTGAPVPAPLNILELLVQTIMTQGKSECVCFPPGAPPGQALTLFSSGHSGWPYISRPPNPALSCLAVEITAQSSPWVAAAITEYHRLRGFNNTFISHSSGGWRSRVHMDKFLVRALFLAFTSLSLESVLKEVPGLLFI